MVRSSEMILVISRCVSSPVRASLGPVRRSLGPVLGTLGPVLGSVRGWLGPVRGSLGPVLGRAWTASGCGSSSGSLGPVSGSAILRRGRPGVIATAPNLTDPSLTSAGNRTQKRVSASAALVYHGRSTITTGAASIYCGARPCRRPHS